MRDRRLPFERVLRRVPAQHDRRDAVVAVGIEREAPAAPPGCGGDRRRYAECLQQVPHVELSERLRALERRRPCGLRQVHGQRGLTFQELVDVQQLLRRLREPAQRARHRGVAPDRTELRRECSSRARPHTRFELHEAVERSAVQRARA